MYTMAAFGSSKGSGSYPSENLFKDFNSENSPSTSSTATTSPIRRKLTRRQRLNRSSGVEWVTLSQSPPSGSPGSEPISGLTPSSSGLTPSSSGLTPSSSSLTPSSSGLTPSVTSASVGSPRKRLSRAQRLNRYSRSQVIITPERENASEGPLSGVLSPEGLGRDESGLSTSDAERSKKKAYVPAEEIYEELMKHVLNKLFPNLIKRVEILSNLLFRAQSNPSLLNDPIMIEEKLTKGFSLNIQQILSTVFDLLMKREKKVLTENKLFLVFLDLVLRSYNKNILEQIYAIMRFLRNAEERQNTTIDEYIHNHKHIVAEYIGKYLLSDDLQTIVNQASDDIIKKIQIVRGEIPSDEDEFSSHDLTRSLKKKSDREKSTQQEAEETITLLQQALQQKTLDDEPRLPSRITLLQQALQQKTLDDEPRLPRSPASARPRADDEKREALFEIIMTTTKEMIKKTHFDFNQNQQEYFLEMLEKDLETINTTAFLEGLITPLQYKRELRWNKGKWGHHLYPDIFTKYKQTLSEEERNLVDTKLFEFRDLVWAELTKNDSIKHFFIAKGGRPTRRKRKKPSNNKKTFRRDLY